jgi:long-chain acyl-CoA synthetase
MRSFIPKDHPRMPEYRFGKRRLDQYLKIHAGRVPEKTSINYYGREITWAQLDGYVDKMATYLSKLGVKKGDVVCVFMQSCPQFMISFYAVQRLGGIVAPCSPMFKEWELEYEANEVAAKVIVANSYLYPIIQNIRANTKLEHVIISPVGEFLPETPELPFNFNEPEPADVSGAVFLKDILAGTEIDVPEVETDMEEIGLLIFTSGSTGLPKGAMLSYMSALYKAVVSATCYHTTEYTKYLCSQPIYHIAGMVFMNCHIYLGSTMYMITKIEAETLIKAIDRYKCDYWYGSALMNKAILEHPDVSKYDLSSLRLAVTTSFGIQLTEEMARQWAGITNGGVLVEWAYGLSESHTMDTGTPEGLPKYGTCGTAVFDDTLIKIVDEEGNEVPADEIGEITLKHPAVFKGYLNNPEATAANLRDGWLYTGDTGKVDEEGYLSFLGRKKEMIKSSGYSVFPEEVEMYLCRNEKVAQAIAIGKPDETKGEIIKAFVVLKPEYKGKVSEEEILEWAKEKMAAYKRPREVEFRDGLPATGTGKLLRRVLRDEEAAKK